MYHSQKRDHSKGPGINNQMSAKNEFYSKIQFSHSSDYWFLEVKKKASQDAKIAATIKVSNITLIICLVFFLIFTKTCVAGKSISATMYSSGYLY